MDKAKVTQWIMDKFLDWQKQQGQRRTITDFSEYIGVGNATVTKWLNGDRTPRGVYVDIVARKLGDEIYELMGMQKKPKSTLHDAVYDELHQDQKEKIDSMIRNFAEQNKRANAAARAKHTS